MSSILTVPMEVLLDAFRADDPVDMEALQLTCRRFRDTILQNVDTLPMRLFCELAFDHSDQVHLYRAPANKEDDRVWWDADRESTARSRWPSLEIQHIKTAIRTVEVYVGDDTDGPDGRLTRLTDNFPSVKSALSLVIDINIASAILPSDHVLHYFGRLETIVVRMRGCDKDSSFWSGLFATKVFRRVSNFLMWNTLGQYPAVDDRELFDFIKDFLHMPEDKTRVVYLSGLGGRSMDALERRFNENIDLIGGQVCAVISGSGDHGYRYLTNMADGSQKKLLAEQLLRDV